MFQTRLARLDWLAVATVLLAACLLWIPFGGQRDADVLIITTSDGRSEYALSKDREIEVTSNGHRLLIVISDGAASVRESDCPDGVCVASGEIHYAGESILCAPAGVTLTVQKGGGDNVDFIAG